MKSIIHTEALRGHIKNGVARLAHIVGKTLGPGGLPILIEREGQALNGKPLAPKITKDGVSVANECMGETPEEDVIIQTVKDICQKTNADAGDGTTTAIVLGHAILNEASKWFKNENGFSPQEVKRELDVACELVVDELKVNSWSVEDSELIKQVATISANGDAEIGAVISEAFKAVGAEGVVTVEQGSGRDVSLNVVEGYQFARGAQGRQNFFNNSDQTAFEGENVAVIMFDGSIRSHTQIIPLLMMLAEVDQATGVPGKELPPTLIIANEFSRDVIQFMLIQKAEHGMRLCPVVGPNLTNIRTGYYDDLAAFTGGMRMGNGGASLEAIGPQHVGICAKVIVDTYKTTIYDGAGSEEEILARVDQLTALRENAESPYDAQVTNDRIAALTSGVAKISVGGATEVEVLEKYDRIEDALNAARAALKEGVILGGGVALLRASIFLQKHALSSRGSTILSAALQAPIRKILINTGVSEDTWTNITMDIMKTGEYAVYDAVARKVVTDGRKEGIIDPLAVTKAALRNAVSVAGLLLTTGGAIVNTEENK